MINSDQALGIWQIINSSIVTDIIAKSGFDFIIIDLEHGSHSTESVQNCLNTSKASSTKTVVRLPNISYSNLVQIIDTGVDAIIFPKIETTDQIDNIIKKTFLFPIGERSFSPFVPRFNYGSNKSKTNLNPSLGILIESLLGIKNISTLTKNPHVDFIYFGAYDLSVELGKPGEIFDKEIIKYLEYLINKVKINNKKIMSIYRNKEELKILLNMGVNYPVSSVDTSHIKQKLTDESKEFFKLKNNLGNSK